ESSPGKVYAHYQRLLTWSLQHKLVVSLLVLVLFINGLGLAVRLPTGFLPELNMNQIYVDLQMPAGTSLPTMDKLTRKIEEKILEEEKERIAYLQTKIGSAEEEVKKPHTLALTLSVQS